MPEKASLALVLAQNATDTPQTREPRRQLSPRVAGRERARRVEALSDSRAAIHDEWAVRP